MKLVVLVPMLHRGHRVLPLLDSVSSTVPDARVLFLCTPGDTVVLDAVDAAGGERLLVDWSPVGDYARKINAGYRATTEELLFAAADDLLFHPGWFEAACRRLVGRVGVVGTNDLGNPRVKAGRHATHSLVTRDYVDRFGTIDGPGQVLFEGYVHEYVDDEFVGTARKRNRFAFARDAVVEHLHPHWGKAPTDALYDAQAERMAASVHLFRGRRRRWM